MFSPKAECIESSPSTQTFLLGFHRVWPNPIPIGDPMAIQFQFVPCESAAETLFSFAFGSQKIKVIKLLPGLFYFQEHNKRKKAYLWEGRNKGVWFRQGLVKRRSGCPFKLERAGWNAEAIDAMLGLNFWMPDWTINCVFIFCWHVVP